MEVIHRAVQNNFGQHKQSVQELIWDTTSGLKGYLSLHFNIILYFDHDLKKS